MNSNRIDQQQQQQQHNSSNSNSSSIRRSSLLVNLSTTKKRSSVTTFLASSCSTLGSRKRSSEFCYSPTSAPITNDEQMRSSQQVDGANNSFCYRMAKDDDMGSFVRPAANNGADGQDNSVLHKIVVCPRSAPPSLNEPSYSIAASDPNSSGKILIEKLENSTSMARADTLIRSSQFIESTPTKSPPSQTNTNQQHKKLSFFQINELVGGPRETSSSIKIAEGDEDEVGGTRERQQVKYTNTDSSSRRGSKEDSPEPIVEVKHTSSSSSGSSECDNSASSDNNEDSSTKLIRRRTVRRYHRAFVDEPTISGDKVQFEESHVPSSHVELTISINKSDQNKQQPTSDRGQSELVRSQFRTRQIGGYSSNQQQVKQQQQQQHTKTASSSSSSSSLTSSTSKIAKCSITTNRKSTTSHRELISKSSLSSKQESSNHFDSKKSTSSGSQSATMQRDNGSHGLQNGGLKAPEATTQSAEPKTQGQRLLEMRLNNQFKSDLIDHRANNNLVENSIEVNRQQEESSVHHSRQSFSSSSMSTSMRAGSLRKAAISSSLASEAAALVSKHTKSNGLLSSSNLSTSSSSSRHFKSSLLVSGDGASTSNNENPDSTVSSLSKDTTVFLDSESLFASPDVRSLVKEIGTDFAELENALSSTATSSFRKGGASSLSSRLFGGAGRRPLSPMDGINQYPAITSAAFSREDNLNSKLSSDSKLHPVISSSQSSLTADKDFVFPACKFNRYKSNLSSASESSDLGSSRPNSERIRELMNQAQSHVDRYGISPASSNSNLSGNNGAPTATQTTAASRLQGPSSSSASRFESGADQRRQEVEKERADKYEGAKLHQNHCKAVMTESIERIDQRMSDLCKKFSECRDTEEAIDLLKIMIQMIEKAWSVPVCGDDLGFKLCNSLREAGGLDIILGLIQDSDISREMMVGAKSQSCAYVPPVLFNGEPVECKSSPTNQPDNGAKVAEHESGSKGREPSINVRAKNKSSTNPLRLNLSKLNNQCSESAQSLDPPQAVAHNATGQSVDNNTSKSAITATQAAKDSDSDILTSDLGLDSTSVDSLSYVTPPSVDSKPRIYEKKPDKVAKETDSDASADPVEAQTSSNDLNEEQNEKHELEKEEEEEEDEEENEAEEEKTNLMKDELVFLSARLLSQCLTSENRNYIVGNGLDQVIRLACNLITMKSTQCKRLLSAVNKQQATGAQAEVAEDPTRTSEPDTQKQQQPTKAQQLITQNQQKQQQQQLNDQSDMHAIIGTEILQHLFKHSEDTCSRLISLGGLEAILYGCRSSNIETLRHCASALANLALYGGPEGQQMMIEQKAHVWLFPLAFNEDDNIQYYACLAIVVLVANQEIEADVLKSSTLDLVEPFVTSHEPQKFAESTTSHIHGQSPSWLRRLIPLLESKREEARNLACFHFAMEAYIKKEQGQTQVFKEIGAVEPLKKVGSSPIAIASKFACQALRLIGEKVPHKLSQQVPLWTSEDVSEWVSQIGFERFRAAFVDSRVDGDLLLQLDEDMLRTDIGIENGIIRRRFLRELSQLKRIADYSSVDKTGLSSLLGSTGHDFVQYIYPMVQLGVTRDNIHLLDSEQLLRECKVANTIHRMKLAHAMKGLQEKMAVAAASNECCSTDGTEQKTLDVFMSYRRSTGSQLASLLKVFLELRNFSVFIDVDRLEAGKFDNNLLDSIKAAKNFILILSPNALDRCIGDHECKDWVHKEIVAALSSNCNIIPIIDNFHWPDPEQLPEDMRSITYFNGVRWIHDYQDACVDKVERFIRGEINNGTSCFIGPQSIQSTQSSLQRLACGSTYSSTPSIVATPSIAPGGFPSGSTSAYSSRPPFDTDCHPLSFANQYLHSQTTASGGRRQP